MGGHLYIVSLGPDPGLITLHAIEVLKSCDTVYFEEYTSIPSRGSILDIEAIVGRGFKKLYRRDLEDRDAEIIFRDLERGLNVCLASWGDSMMATTHVSIARKAVEEGYGYSYIPGISIVTMGFGYSGLMIYRLGRVATITRPWNGVLSEHPYDVLKSNMDRDLHTLFLLDIDVEKSYYMSVPEAIDILYKIEESRGNGIINGSLKAVALIGVGVDGRVCYSTLESLRRMRDLDIYPQSLIIPSKLYFTEAEYLDSMVSRFGVCWHINGSR